MIIDAHVHAFLPFPSGEEWWEKKEAEDLTEDLISQMDAYLVSKAVIMAAHCTNEQNQSAVRRHPDRLVSFCRWEEYGMSGKDAAEVCQKWLREPEFIGVGEALLSQFWVKGKVETMPEIMMEFRQVMDVVSEHKAPILLHTGFTGGHSGRGARPVRWHDPIYIDDLAYEYPDVPIIIGHSGGLYPPYDQNALLCAYNHPNIFLETSKSRTDVIEQAAKEIGASRILFGTDWHGVEALDHGPMSERHTHLYPRNIKVLEEAKISDDDKDMIFYKNIKSLLNI